MSKPNYIKIEPLRNSNKSNEIFKCPACDFTTTTQELLDSHVKEENDKIDFQMSLTEYLNSGKFDWIRMMRNDSDNDSKSD